MTKLDAEHSTEFGVSFRDLGDAISANTQYYSGGHDFAFLAVDRARKTLDTLSKVRGVITKDKPLDGLLPEPNVEIGYLNSTRFNAYCHARPDIGSFHLGMPIIAPACMVEFCGHFFCRPEFYPEIGIPQPNIEKSANQMLRQAVAASGQDAYPGALIKSLGRSEMPLELKDFQTLAFACLPDDVTRRAAALYFAHQLTYFIWLHEMAHMAHGHIEKLELRSGVPFRLCEFEEEGPLGLDQRQPSSLSQLCEIDADTRAARLVVTQMLLGDDPTYGPKNPFETPIDLRIEIFIYLLTMFHFVQWFEQKNTNSSYHEGSHPPSLVRAACSIMQIIHLTPVAREPIHQALAKIIGWEEAMISDSHFKDLKMLVGNQIYEICDDWISTTTARVRTSKAGYYGFGWLEFAINPELQR